MDGYSTELGPLPFMGLCKYLPATHIICSFDKQIHGDVDILFYFIGGTVNKA